MTRRRRPILTVDHLIAKRACEEQVAVFRATFPGGGTAHTPVPLESPTRWPERGVVRLAAAHPAPGAVRDGQRPRAPRLPSAVAGGGPLTTRKLARLLDRDCLVRHTPRITEGMVTSGTIRDVYETCGVLYCTVEVGTLTADGRLSRAEHDLPADRVWLPAFPTMAVTTTYITALEALNAA